MHSSQAFLWFSRSLPDKCLVYGAKSKYTCNWFVCVMTFCCMEKLHINCKICLLPLWLELGVVDLENSTPESYISYATVGLNSLMFSPKVHVVFPLDTLSCTHTSTLPWLIVEEYAHQINALFDSGSFWGDVLPVFSRLHSLCPRSDSIINLAKLWSAQGRR